MAAILPGSPPAFDRGDVAGTVKALCGYSGGMQEQVDFLLGQLQKQTAELEGRVAALEQKQS